MSATKTADSRLSLAALPDTVKAVRRQVTFSRSWPNVAQVQRRNGAAANHLRHDDIIEHMDAVARSDSPLGSPELLYAAGIQRSACPLLRINPPRTG